MNNVYRLVLVVCALTLMPLRGNASAVDVELNYYTKANHLVNAGRYQQASEQWHRLTILFLSSEAKLGRKRMWQFAGLSEALAAISADKANDAMAYQYWADSTRYLMTGGTNWKQMRKKLHRRYEHANTLLSTQLQVADLARVLIVNGKMNWQCYRAGMKSSRYLALKAPSWVWPTDKCRLQVFSQWRPYLL